MQSKHHSFKLLHKEPVTTKFVVKSALEGKKELMVSRFGHEDSLIACGYADGLVRVFSANTEKPIYEVSVKENYPVCALRWRPSTTSGTPILLAASTSGRLVQLGGKAGKQLFEAVQEENFLYSLDYRKDGALFATAGTDNSIRIYDEETKKISQRLGGVKWHTKGHNNTIYSIKFHPIDSNTMVSGGSDLNVNIWDLREEKAVGNICGPKLNGDALDINAKFLLTGSYRKKQQLELWDLRTQKKQKQLVWDKNQPETDGFVFSAQFAKNDPNMVMAAGGSQVKMFNYVEDREMLELKLTDNNSLYTCDSGRMSNRYCAGSTSGTLYYILSTKSFQ